MAWGMAANRVRVPKPPGEVPRGPKEKRGSDEAGSAALGVGAFCFAFKATGLDSAKPRTKRTQALGGPSAARLKI